MWTTENRARYDRSKLRYPSDLTDEEWAFIKPLIPPAKRGGNKRTVDERDIVNGLMYILSTGCRGRLCPRICHRAARSTTISAAGTTTGPWIASITRSTSNAANWPDERPARRLALSTARASRAQKRGFSHPHGFDAAKKIKGKKRHVLVNTQGLLMQSIVHAADIQDRDGGVMLMASLFGMFPFLLKLYADKGYQGPKFQQGLSRVCRQVNVEIVKRSDVGKFVVLPKRWIVERTIGWLNRCRRLAKDWECLNGNALAFLRGASVRLMVRKLCQNTI